MSRPLASAVLLAPVLALVLAGCATTPAARPGPARAAGPDSGPIDQAFTQPLRDLSLMRVDPSPALMAARAAPYATPEPASCAALAPRIAELDRVLGQDVDSPDAFNSLNNMAGALVSGAIRDAVGLPFRGVLRRLSGAEVRDRELRAYVLAGIVRRAYLKGVAQAHDCPAVAPADG
ncbi:hypothetical protein [Phenylobacterium aquaticum]|uniref:hypothetical protein n=1 Tax=Phenylobacterium aquaticum TaxID=1763816 RepID=UPI0026F35362|nr:hypothetical protein [Phenylobacterium aquaticum]